LKEVVPQTAPGFTGPWAANPPEKGGAESCRLHAKMKFVSLLSRPRDDLSRNSDKIAFINDPSIANLSFNQ
jgi:hypothetical protein